MNLLDSTWFYWAVGIAIGLPAGLIVLTELHNILVRRNSHLARQASLLRNYLLPLGAVLLLLVKASEVPAEDPTVRVLTTAFGFLVLVLLLSLLNATLFQGAPQQSWRKRLPAIFVDVARFALIGIGLAVILSYIWGVRVGGLFAALGVTSVVIGLMLQNSVGQIVSGLFMLFEQPFRIDDWLETPTARGRVVEVNGGLSISTPAADCRSCPTRCWPPPRLPISAGRPGRTNARSRPHFPRPIRRRVLDGRTCGVRPAHGGGARAATEL